ncbi:MAG: exodeoxyribonuclease VII large subunit [Planctomycetota bacterium]
MDDTTSDLFASNTKPQGGAATKQSETGGIFGKRSVLTVTELTRKIKLSLENTFGEVWVNGEVSNLRVPASGHMYFSFKDETSQIRCVLFSSAARAIKFKIENGMELIIRGRVTVYEKSGDYQIIIDRAEPKGVGALQLALEQLKQKLAKEGLFDEAHKKPLPLLPERIGIVTSATGAAIQDIVTIIQRRFPRVALLICPVKVQGEGAREEIAQAIDNLNTRDDVDVIIVGRGGGSIEDLWAFNEEIVARAIYRSRIPVISAVGHETDFTIADFVADKRAKTPSEAAEIAVPVADELDRALESYHRKFVTLLEHSLKMAKSYLDGLVKRYAWQALIDKFLQYQQQLDELSINIASAVKRMYEKTTNRLEQSTKQLDALSPTAILSRGYSITRLADGKLIKSVKQVSENDQINTQLKDGNITSKIIATDTQSK